MAAGFLAAWIRFRPHLGTEGAFTDGQRTIEIESVEELRYAVWDAPLPLPGELNSDEAENAPVISPDGRYIVFVAGVRGLGTDIWICDLDSEGEAREPRPLIGVNSPGDELAPAFASDGALLFSSNRPGGEGGLDLWRSGYSRGVFDSPEHLAGKGLNTSADETDPASVPGSDTIIFASNRLPKTADGSVSRALRNFDLYEARPLPVFEGEKAAWDVVAITEVNSSLDERDPVLSVDGRALMFSSDRGESEASLFGLATGSNSTNYIGSRAAASTDTDFDLYRSARKPLDHPDPDFKDNWLPPRALEGVNTPASERHPQPTADGFALLFSRGTEFESAENGTRMRLADEEVNWDIWRATSREVVRTPGKPIGWREIMILLALLCLALLAALAKRWKGMDIIYKAFLVSLLIHLALLFYSREVVPDAGEIELRKGEEQRVRVRLMEDPNSTEAQANEERGGRLEAARAEVQAAADSPALKDPFSAEMVELASAPTAMGAMSRAERELESAPAKADAALPERAPEAANAPSTEVASASENYERKTGEAALLEVAASNVEANRTESQRSEVTRDSALAAAQAEVSTERSTDSTQLVKATRAPDSASEAVPGRRKVLVDRSATEALLDDGTRAPEITGPATEFSRKVADGRRAIEVETSSSSSLDGRAAPTDPGDVRAEAPRAGAAGEISIDVAPTATAALQRSKSRSALIGGAPVRTESDVEPTGPAAPSSVSVALNGPADVEPTRDPGAVAQAFDALEGGGAASSDLERSADRSASVGEPTIASGGTPGSESDLASAGELAPSALAPLGRSRAKTGDAPSFQGAGPEASSVEISRSGPSPASDRNIKVADAEPVEQKTPVAGTGGTPGAGATGADLALVDSVAPLSRSSRDRGEAQGPGPVSPGPGARTEADGFDAPTPLAIEMTAPDAPAPIAGVPAAKLDRDQWDRTPYQSRTGERKIAALEEFGGGAETEAAVESGLAYLSRRQRTDGRWGRKEVDEKYGQPMIGKTGLACLAFMGAGHTPTSNTQYSETVAKGLAFLRKSQDAASGHIGNTTSYGHAIATYALGEAFALTKAPELRDPLVRATQHIVDRQVASRDPLLDGGWSYFYADSRTFDRWPRASVTAWQVMALESAKLGGIDVPKSVFARARTFLVNAWDPSRGAFRYSHDPSRLRSDYPLLPGSTPATMFALSLLGADIGQEQFMPARDFVLARSPKGYRFSGDDDFVYKAQGNLYFWYYGTLAMFRAGGGDWKRWNTAMKETLVPAQEQDGSWRPISIYAGYAQDSDGDRSYTTAMNVLTLEVYYRYFTPLLKVE